MTIRNPIEWATDQLKLAGLVVGSASRAGVATDARGYIVVDEGLQTSVPGISARRSHNVCAAVKRIAMWAS